MVLMEIYLLYLEIAPFDNFKRVAFRQPTIFQKSKCHTNVKEAVKMLTSIYSITRCWSLSCLGNKFGYITHFEQMILKKILDLPLGWQQKLNDINELYISFTFA